MDLSAITTTKDNSNNSTASAKKISMILLELAELNLESPETCHYISESGLEKVRRKLAL